MAVAHFVKKARKDYPDYDIKKGESYYWWAFRFGRKHFSKTQPRQSQLTGSAFLSSVYACEEQLSDLQVRQATDHDLKPSDIEDEIEDVVSQLQEASEECQSSLDNMPEGLQQGSTGELLQGRIDEIDSMVSELQSVDCSEDRSVEDIFSDLDCITYNGE